MKVKIGNNEFKVKVMDNPISRAEGMMGKEFNDNYNGMLFLMEEPSNCFWMKNCIIPLDIIFIRKNVITKIFKNCPPCIEDDCPSYCSKGSIILEIRGGQSERLGINVGETVRYNVSF